MSAPNDISVRLAAVAGMFYPDDAGECQRLATTYLQPHNQNPPAPQGRRWIGAVVPHAGWICSGAIAGEAMATLAMAGPADVVVIFGAVHTPIPLEVAALDSRQRWAVPGDQVPTAQELNGKLQQASPELFVVDDRFHAREHAIEVEMPLVRRAWPGAAVLPIEVPVAENAAAIGQQTARTLRAAGVNAVFLASSDFTHYGPSYGFVPAGLGLQALRWAKDNDVRLLRIIAAMQVEAVIPEARSRWNACGAGAITAAMAACRELGATAGCVLRHANSFETLANVAPQQPSNAVGYAGVLLG